MLWGDLPGSSVEATLSVHAVFLMPSAAGHARLRLANCQAHMQALMVIQEYANTAAGLPSNTNQREIQMDIA